MPKTYDIAVLGATPAGLAAAWSLARKGRRVVVFDAPRRSAESPLADWVPGDFFRTKAMPAAIARKCRAESFKRVRYHKADLSEMVEYSGRKVAGYFFQSAKLTAALKAAALAAGVKIQASRSCPVIQLGEDVINLIGRKKLTASLLMITHGHPGEAVSDLSMPIHSIRQPPLLSAALEIPISSGKATADLSGVLNVVELRERSEIGLFFAIGRAVHIRMVSFSKASGNRAAELSAMLTDLQRAGILPRNLQLGRARGAVWHPPAGLATEIEMHVAKRCLLAGTAGGFADHVTGQTLWPSVRSAAIAAETALAALDSTTPQLTLSRYKAAWRKELGDYLRPLSTSLQMLLPLLFVNKRLLGRLTRAVLFGENI